MRLELLRGVPLLEAATEAELQLLADASREVDVPRGGLLVLQGERSDVMYVVVTGRLTALLVSDRGDELVLSVLGPGDALGEIAVLDQLSRSATVRASTRSTVLQVPGPAVREVLRSSPVLAMTWAVHLAAQVRTLTGSKADLVFLDLPRRLAKLLLSDATSGQAPVGSQTELAARLGVARQSLNRALGALTSRGWVRVDGTVVVLRDADALARFAAS